MRILRNSSTFPVFALCFTAIAARVGFIAASWILLVTRFGLDPIVSGIMSAGMQGAITLMVPVSRQIFNRLSLLKSQRAGALLGMVSCLALLNANSMIVFIVVVTVASFSKVAIEATFPRITHSMLLEDVKFSPRLMGTQQGAVLFVSAVIAPVALLGSETGPMYIAFTLYFATCMVTMLLPKCGFDSYEEIITTDSKQKVFDRRFTDMANNECVRARQSRIHKFRRIPSTLLSLDLASQIIGGGSVAIMPLCFIHISKVSQGMDSALCFTFGIFAAITGLMLIPHILKRVGLSEKQEWIIICSAVAISLFTCSLYTTYFGIEVALVSAVVNGCVVVCMQTFLHRMASRNLTQQQYQEFGCKLMQRNAIARVLTPLFLGGVATATSLHFAFWTLMAMSAIFSLVLVARVSLIVYGRKSDLKALSFIEGALESTGEMQTLRRTRDDFDSEDSRVISELFEQRVRSRDELAAYNRLRFRAFLFRSSTAFSQKDSDVDAARGAPG